MKDDSAKAFLGDLRDSLAGSHDTGDPTTTNVYLGNLSPQLTEQELMEMFGKYGPLVSDNDIDFKLRAILVQILCMLFQKRSCNLFVMLLILGKYQNNVA